MDPQKFRALVESADSAALDAQARAFNKRDAALKENFNRQIAELTEKVTSEGHSAPNGCVRRNTNRCDDPLDAVKCLAELKRSQETYVSWRQAAMAAYKIFRRHNGSSRLTRQ